MSLFSKNAFMAKSILIVCLFVSFSASAINIKGLYRAACERELGLIVRVGDNVIDFLTVEGDLKRIRRHEVIFLADYPLDGFFNQKPVQMNVPSTVIETEQNNRIEKLVQGWPIGFTQDKISFLDQGGQEVIIDRTSIHSVTFQRLSQKLNFKQQRQKIHFVHPYSFRDCPSGAGKKVYPQQVLSDPVVIKRELDRLYEGYEKIDRYHREQKFYSVPLIFENDTRLGIWHNFGSRYGASEKRVNNFTPFLITEYASDVFDYQHRFVTGSGPIKRSVHTEAQTQALYEFKASYFHFGAMFDPDVILVGENYDWRAEDFSDVDFKMNNSILLEMGFDFGKWSLFGHTFDLNWGSFDGSTFIGDSVSGSGLGVNFRNHLFQVNTRYGSAAESKSDSGNPTEINFDFLRMNVDAYFFDKVDIAYSFILRNFESDHLSEFQSESMVHGFEGSYELTDRIRLGAYLSFESLDHEYGANLASSKSDTHLKSGFSAFLSF